MTRVINLTHGKQALVDDADYEWLRQWNWAAISKDRYAGRYFRANGKVILLPMHRAIMVPPADMVVDHLDHNGLNNQRSNLRIVTQSENMRTWRLQKPTDVKKAIRAHKGDLVQYSGSFTVDTHARLQRIALQEHTSISEILRRAADDYLAKYEEAEHAA